MTSRQSNDLFERLKRSVGPLAGGIILDLLDLATLMPFGLAYGWLLGAAVAWWIGSLYGFSRGKKLLLSALAAVYCIVPLTEFIPLATLLAVAVRFFEEPETPGPKPPPPPSGRKQVESKEVKPEEQKEE